MSAHVTWPPERFFFALLDTDGLQRSWGISHIPHTQLGYLFEDVLPVPIEQIHAIYRPAGKHQVVACGVSLDRLERDLPDGAESLTPSHLPSHLPDDVDPRSLNLLTGPYTPAPVAAARRKRALLSACAALLVALLVVVGLERRRAHAAEAVAVYREAHGAFLDRALGPAAPGIPNVQRLAALVGERRRLEWTRSQPPQAQPVDVSRTLGVLLESWPQETVWVDALNVTESALTVRGFAEKTAVAERIAAALGSLDGWDLEPPELRRTPDGVRFTLRLRSATKGRP